MKKFKFFFKMFMNIKYFFHALIIFLIILIYFLNFNEKNKFYE